MEFNFEATSTDGICKITRQRADELAGILASVAHEIEQNYKDYSYKPQVDDDDALGMHKGKVLQRFLQSVTDPQEQIFLLMLFETLGDILIEQVRKKSLVDALKSGLKSYIENMAGKESEI